MKKVKVEGTTDGNGNITIECECGSCHGTGLYKGMSERGACAVVCASCKGTGKSSVTIKTFEGRKDKKGIKRVFKSSFGYVHGHEDVETEEGITILFSDGGCTYEEWQKDVEPKPVKSLYCPYIWDNRGMGNEPCSRCKDGCGLGGSISKCKFFKDKAKCWVEYGKGKS